MQTQNKYYGTLEKLKRQFNLIRYISYLLICVALFLIPIYIQEKLWYMVAILSVATVLALINLWILERTRNTVFCGHVAAVIVFVTIGSANYLIWGLETIHSQWFYVVPMMVAILIGMRSLFIYGILTLALLLLFGLYPVPAYYTLPHYLFVIIHWINDIFAFIVVVIIMASMLHENKRYEETLTVNNFLLEAEKERYHYLSQVDQLTGLPNRRFFTKSLHDKIDALTTNNNLTVFFIDLDNFKQVNDRYGHNIGDQLLLETSKRLKICFRENDFIARLGGDEFTAVVSHAPNKNVPIIISQRIIREFEHPLILDNGVEYHYAISIGYATCPDDAKTATDLIVKADLAMYAAKKVEGNSFWQASQKS